MEILRILEAPSKRLPGITSLYVLIENKSSKLFDLFIQSKDLFYDSKLNIFEFSTNKLYYIINFALNYYNIKYIPYKIDNNKYIKINNYKFKVKPYKHLIEGIEYGLNHNNWLLLDDQGLGKTYQMICLADILKQTTGLLHCLIICGVNGLKYNWEAEIKQYSNLTCTILGLTITKTGKSKIASVSERIKLLKNGLDEFFVITNVEILQNKEFAEAFNKSKSKFDMIVLDEAHKLKNPSSKSSKTLLKLKSNHNIALTGTIIMNKPENAYVALKWTNNVTSNYSLFKLMFNVYGGFGGVQVIGYKNLDILQELMLSCSLRRLKSEVLDLPIRNYLIDYVEMGPQQTLLYNEVADGIATELNLLPNKPTILLELSINLRLRLITAYPGILSSEINKSAKLDRLEELIETIVAQGDKVVVMNSFKGAVDEEAKRLSIYNPVICTGSLSDDEIIKNRYIFLNNDLCKVLLGTWLKMGTGHTLTAANYMIFVDTPWTDADFKQSADRIYRIGQTKPVFIITLITKNTYDERVQEIIEHKECLSSYLVDNIDSNVLNIVNE